MSNMPLNLEFANFTKSRVWKHLQDWFEKRVKEEKDEFFNIDDDDEQSLRNQKQRVRLAEELAGEFRIFVLNSANSRK